jgi:PilZ domain
MNVTHTATSKPRVERRYARVPVDLCVFARTADDRLADRVIDLCESGAKVQTERPLPVGGRYAFSFEVPKASHSVEVIAEVAWTHGALMGLSFQSEPRLVAFVEKQRRDRARL